MYQFLVYICMFYMTVQRFVTIKWQEKASQIKGDVALRTEIQKTQ